LSYLHRFEVDTLKIDRSFVDGIGDGGHAERLVEAIVRMAQSLDLSIVAEGVEELEQARWLRERGCELAQGYLFARPMPADDLLQLLASPRGPALDRDVDDLRLRGVEAQDPTTARR
jgi:EAL domain-containing protein (putative c-di-GMP-specific phosphodiesterase class I)